MRTATCTDTVKRGKGHLVEIDHLEDGIGKLLDAAAVVFLDEAGQGGRK